MRCGRGYTRQAAPGRPGHAGPARPSAPAGEDLARRAFPGPQGSFHQARPVTGRVLPGEVDPPGRRADDLRVTRGRRDGVRRVGLTGPGIVVPGGDERRGLVQVQVRAQRGHVGGPGGGPVGDGQGGQARLGAGKGVQHRLNPAARVGCRPGPEPARHALHRGGAGRPVQRHVQLGVVRQAAARPGFPLAAGDRRRDRQVTQDGHGHRDDRRVPGGHPARAGHQDAPVIVLHGAGRAAQPYRRAEPAGRVPGPPPGCPRPPARTGAG